jgi:hypothetical protein
MSKHAVAIRVFPLKGVVQDSSPLPYDRVAGRGTLVRLALRAPDQPTIDMRPRSLIEQMNEDQASAQNGTT